ncbi:S-layer homology domain-containing protein [Peptoniphilus genitalis]|uniref:S-layer homology domain-containing protein n=1 Tax=Peptoniphilus genitalis TaxID=3036303 RepID=A0ABY4TKU6_9FIRM|nr:S-layer homology domain-containing protein [Peptoniphilus sp. SAHP1]URN40956.1 S-layer homology domain-containing protein [Peptoniphilus sp. SAHP1]
MNKKIISLVLALVMVLGTFTSVFAEAAKADAKKEEVKKTETKKAKAGEKVEKVVGKDNKIQYVIDKKLVEGYEDGTYGLDKNIKRSEITRLLVLANGNEELAKQLQGSMKIYSDVDAKHWANGVISVGTTVPSDANGIAMLAGYPDGSFKPENDVTYAELAKMLVVLAKEDLTADMVKNAKWATSWMTWAAQLGILDDVNVVDSNKAANRADAFTMVYNALYAMKEFKRVPANETRGIVSNLTNSKLTLNQDSEKEYTITGDTVIVDGINVRKQIVKVNSLNNLDLYKGSLVRILVNDKNEVTHIIELGNPEVLARTDKEGELLDTDNHIWEGVADATVETNYYKNIESLKDLDQKKVDRAYATVTLNGSKTKADYIKFHKANGNELANLKVNDKTEIYVANPYNNIMKEVKDINEALSLIGFHNYGKDYKIPNVYAGFDTDDHKSAVKSFNSERSTAKVIVFNVVSKDNDGDRYRVINSSSSKFSSTLEDTDGKLYDRDNVLNKANFPLNYGDLLDVIETRGDVIDRLLDHSDEKAFPVVRVLRVFDNDEIRVEDRFGNETLLYVGDADIFNAKQYKDLAKGDYLQFTANNKDARDIEIVSILDDSKDTRDLFDKSGSVLKVVQGIEDHTVVGVIKWVGEKQVEIKIESDNWDAGLNNTTKTYKVDRELADALKAYVGKEVKFKAENKNYENDVRAYDFMLNDGKNVLIAPKANKNLTELEKVVNAYYESGLLSTDFDKANEDIDKVKDASYNEKKAAKDEIKKYRDEKVVPAQKATPVEFKTKSVDSNEAAIKAAKEEAAKAQKLVDALKDSKGKDDLQARIDAYNKTIKAAEDKLAVAEKQTAYDNYAKAVFAKLANLEVKSSDSKTELEANVKAAVEAAIKDVEGKPADAKVVIGDINTADKKVKVKVVSDNLKIDQKEGAEKEITFAVK